MATAESKPSKPSYITVRGPLRVSYCSQADRNWDTVSYLVDDDIEYPVINPNKLHNSRRHNRVRGADADLSQEDYGFLCQTRFNDGVTVLKGGVYQKVPIRGILSMHFLNEDDSCAAHIYCCPVCVTVNESDYAVIIPKKIFDSPQFQSRVVNKLQAGGGVSQ